MNDETNNVKNDSEKSGTGLTLHPSIVAKGFTPLPRDPRDLTKEQVRAVFDPKRVREFVRKVNRR